MVEMTFRVAHLRQAAVAAVSGLTLAACSQSVPREPADAFNLPPAWPGYQWSFHGKQVGSQVISTAAGPSHCGWQKATFLTLGWPPGTPSETSEGARQYIRDSQRTVDSSHLLSKLDLNAHLPADAKPTGLTYDDLSLYTASDADTSIYVVGPHVTERWPRSDPMTLCS